MPRTRRRRSVPSGRTERPRRSSSENGRAVNTMSRAVEIADEMGGVVEVQKQVGYIDRFGLRHTVRHTDYSYDTGCPPVSHIDYRED